MAQAAFIVQPDVDGSSAGTAGTKNPLMSYGNGGTTNSWSVAGTAVGLQPGNSAYGGNGTPGDQYIFSYTPGTNADNVAFTAGDDLGNGNVATGVTGGGSGQYNVYVAWPNTNNISDDGATPTNYVATSDGPSVSADFNQDEHTNGALVGGPWVFLGTVQLTAGNTYTVTQTAPNSSFVSMRAAGVMWEAVPVPEPTSLGLLALGLPLALRRRRA
jgi:hypothetical protein